MSTPNNAAAEQIVRSNSIITDLTQQMSEINSAISRQLDLIESLTPLAEWAPADPTDVGEGEPDTPVVK